MQEEAERRDHDRRARERAEQERGERDRASRNRDFSRGPASPPEAYWGSIPKVAGGDAERSGGKSQLSEFFNRIVGLLVIGMAVAYFYSKSDWKRETPSNSGGTAAIRPGATNTSDGQPDSETNQIKTAQPTPSTHSPENRSRSFAAPDSNGQIELVAQRVPGEEVHAAVSLGATWNYAWIKMQITRHPTIFRDIPTIVLWMTWDEPTASAVKIHYDENGFTPDEVAQIRETFRSAMRSFGDKFATVSLVMSPIR